MSVKRIYCTYFDHFYLPRALALYQSLKLHSENFSLWALCFDDISYQRLKEQNLPEVRPINHEEFTHGDYQLLAARNNRSLIEYYFTCSPSLPLFVFNNDPSIDQVTYLDADLYFFSDPSPLFNEIGSASIAIIAHRFSPTLKNLEENGIFNVAWLTFRRDEEGIDCLYRWRNQCLEWCYDRIEGTKFADQGYLNEWPETFRNLAIIQHKGANLAPWNVSRYHLTGRERRIWVDDDPLIFFHFQGLGYIRPGIYKLNFSKYKLKASRFIKREIYKPYLRTLEGITQKEELTKELGRIRNPFDALDFLPRLRGFSPRIWLRSISELARGDYIFLWNLF